MSKKLNSTTAAATAKALPKARAGSKSKVTPRVTAKTRPTLKPKSSPMPQEDPKHSGPFNLFFWLLLLVVSLAVGLGIIYLNQAGPTATSVSNQPQEAPVASEDVEGDAAGDATGEEAGALTIEKYLIPEHGVIQIVAANGSDETVIAPQVMVDDAYWDFDVDPSTTIPAGGVVTYTLPYPWVAGELPEVLLVTSRGETVESEVEPTIEISGEATSAQ